MSAVLRYSRAVSTVGVLLSASVFGCGTDASGAKDGDPLKELLARVDRYQSLLAHEKHAESYEMVARAWRTGGRDKQEWVAYATRMGRGVKIRGWSVASISALDNRARVSLSVQAETDDEPRIETVTEIQFWQYENGDWYYIPIQVSDWDDAKAVAVRPLARWYASWWTSTSRSAFVRCEARWPRRRKPRNAGIHACGSSACSVVRTQVPRFLTEDLICADLDSRPAARWTRFWGALTPRSCVTISDRTVSPRAPDSTGQKSRKRLHSRRYALRKRE